MKIPKPICTCLSALLLSTFTLSISATNASGQGFRWPDKAENLQVLPDTISGQELGQFMRGFAGSLGVRCEYCHVGEPGQSLAEFDFASDAKPAKEKARVMLKTVRAINTEYLSMFDNIDDSGEPRISVTCITCHRGRPKPVMLEDLVAATATSDGADAAVEEYKELRERYYGGFAFDFQDGTLTDAAQKLSGDGNHAGALTIMALELEMSGKSLSNLIASAQIFDAAGQKEAAIGALQEALEMAPDRRKPRIQAMIDSMQE